MYDISTGRKTITVKRLAELLNDLSDNYLLEVNTVGNLLITHNGEYIGFVDFNDESTSRV